MTIDGPTALVLVALIGMVTQIVLAWQAHQRSKDNQRTLETVKTQTDGMSKALVSAAEAKGAKQGAEEARIAKLIEDGLIARGYAAGQAATAAPAGPAPSIPTQDTAAKIQIEAAQVQVKAADVQASAAAAQVAKINPPEGYAAGQAAAAADAAQAGAADAVKTPNQPPEGMIK